MEGLTPQQVDCILYNLSSWRRLVNSIEPKTSASVVILPAVSSGRTSSSSIERAAVKRAAVSHVLDLAEEALRALPAETRKIAGMKYGEMMSLREIAVELTRRKRKAARRKGLEAEEVSKSWVGAQVDSIREHCARYLCSVRQEFWGEIRTLELRNSGQRW